MEDADQVEPKDEEDDGDVALEDYDLTVANQQLEQKYKAEQEVYKEELVCQKDREECWNHENRIHARSSGVNSSTLIFPDSAENENPLFGHTYGDDPQLRFFSSMTQEEVDARKAELHDHSLKVNAFIEAVLNVCTKQHMNIHY